MEEPRSARSAGDLLQEHVHKLESKVREQRDLVERQYCELRASNSQLMYEVRMLALLHQQDAAKGAVQVKRSCTGAFDDDDVCNTASDKRQDGRPPRVQRQGLESVEKEDIILYRDAAMVQVATTPGKERGEALTVRQVLSSTSFAETTTESERGPPEGKSGGPFNDREQADTGSKVTGVDKDNVWLQPEDVRAKRRHFDADTYAGCEDSTRSSSCVPSATLLEMNSKAVRVNAASQLQTSESILNVVHRDIANLSVVGRANLILSKPIPISENPMDSASPAANGQSAENKRQRCWL